MKLFAALFEPWGDDKRAATRRAVTRTAAAGTGRRMHESLPSEIELINRDAERCRDRLNARPAQGFAVILLGSRLATA